MKRDSESALRIQSAKDAVAEEIRGLIHEGRLGLGERLSIDTLASRFGVSRTPVRDALWQLSTEGLVVITPRVGVFVREISPQEIADVYDIKGALEPLMAAWAAERGSPEARTDFLTSIADLEEVARQGDVSGYVALLEARRDALVAMAGSEGLRDALGVLDGRVRLLRFRNLSQPGRLEESAQGHKTVAEGIAAGDPEAAAAAMHAHMERASARVRQLVEEQDGARTYQHSPR
ncbi:GntR family transcriptional regulator [Phytoactinopolyspora limicola]|uniref:GntR family transcriptional regulator n=1 Tax=Phytoactinopolyspora limicola TaxID=2715536 RepID=UPI0014079E74|nr:GntR family transcriptional regulator [Phytoactinopolyspora limicola]